MITKPPRPAPDEIKEYRGQNLCSLEHAHKDVWRAYRRAWLNEIADFKLGSIPEARVTRAKMDALIEYLKETA